MFKGFNNRQQNGFTNLNFNGDYSAYGQSGCNFWLRADFGLNTQTDGAGISSWIDSVGGYIFEQATAGSQPTLVSSSLSYNNLPVVNFGSLRLIASSKLIPGIRSIAFVANYNNLSTTHNMIISSDLNANQGIFLGGQASGINGVSMRNAAAILTTGTTENTNVKIAVISDNFIMVNGVAESTTNAIIDFSFRTLGNRSPSTGAAATSTNLDGNIAEIIGFSTSLNQSQALALSNNINQKYAIY